MLHQHKGGLTWREEYLHTLEYEALMMSNWLL
jgi:hypothetical protein